MTVEAVNLISDLDQNNPAGGDSISEGDDHIRNIKRALTNTFPNINEAVTTSAEDLNKVTAIVANGNGVFASCKWNGTSLTYGHNVSSVTPSGPKRYLVNFAQPTDGFDNHYAVQVTPMATNNRAVVAMITDQRDNYVQVDMWEFDGSTWGEPASPLGFYMTMTDMIQMEANADT